MHITVNYQLSRREFERGLKQIVRKRNTGVRRVIIVPTRAFTAEETAELRALLDRVPVSNT